MKINTRKIQVVEVPQIRTIKKYDNFYNEGVKKKRRKNKNINKKKEKVIGKVVDMKIILKVLKYVAVSFVFMMIQMHMSYAVGKLGQSKVEKEIELKTLKHQVENLEREYLSNFDLKKIETKSKELGFTYNDTIRYIKID